MLREVRDLGGPWARLVVFLIETNWVGSGQRVAAAYRSNRGRLCLGAYLMISLDPSPCLLVLTYRRLCD